MRPHPFHREGGWPGRAALVGCALGTVLLTGACTDGAAGTTSSPSTTTSEATGTTGGAVASEDRSDASWSTAPTSGADTAAGLEDVPEVARRGQPSVVTVLVPGGTGSGVVYSEDGLVLTNEHVVRGNTAVEIQFADGRVVDGSVAATDAVTDLALVRAERTGLVPAAFADELPEVGSLAVVIGSPLGFQNTVTAGIVSGLHREIPGSAAQGQSLVDLIQTDAPISPGNSGGAVLNGDAEVIGISEAYIPPQQGAVALGFAIPAATAVDIAEQLATTGRATHAFAGLVPARITPDIAARFDLPDDNGVIVADVADGGPAAAAGLQPGDVITAVDGVPTPTPEDFLAELRPHDPGDTLDLAVFRPGAAERTVSLTVTDRPAAG